MKILIQQLTIITSDIPNQNKSYIHTYTRSAYYYHHIREKQKERDTQRHLMQRGTK